MLSGYEINGYRKALTRREKLIARRKSEWLLFTKHFIALSFNSRKAAQAIGRHPSYGSALLQNPYVIKCLDNELKKMQEKLDVTIDWKIQKLAEIVADCTDKSDEKRKQHYKQAISAINELNKMQGHHAAQKHVFDTTEKYRELVESKLSDAVSYDD